MTIHSFSASDFTLVHNQFIDNYMAAANGEFVKIYLYLLRCSSTDVQLTLSSIADVFNVTESDVRRALTYWEKLHLLRLSYDGDGMLTDVAFTDGNAHREQREEREERLGRYAQMAEAETPAKLAVSAQRKRELASQEEVKQLLYIVEQYMKKPLSGTEVNHILYFYDELHFSSDLIEYLIDYCLSKGKRSISYIRKVALEWHAQGITTVDEARRDTTLYHKDYYTVLNAFGIRGRGPAQAETEYMHRWFHELGYTTDVILEACRRTINRTHTPSFPYADSILSGWKERGVRTFGDIARLDKPAPSAASDGQTGAAAGSADRSSFGQASQIPAKAAGTRFNNFTPRNYDFEELEQQFLTSQRRTRHATE